MHDAWANGFFGNGGMPLSYNIGTMLPAAATAYLAILHNQGLIITPPEKEEMNMAKRGWMPENLRNYRNIMAAIGLLTFIGACSGGAGNFDNATNDLIGKNIDYALLGPGYYYHPIAKKVMYFGGKKSKISRVTPDDIIYERRRETCVYEFVVDRRTRILKSWHFVHEDRRYCNLR